MMTLSGDTENGMIINIHDLLQSKGSQMIFFSPTF